MSTNIWRDTAKVGFLIILLFINFSISKILILLFLEYLSCYTMKFDIVHFIPPL